MDFLVTKEVFRSWIFQDERKFKWWADLHNLADEDGIIRMSLGDLAHRWNAPRTSVQRFIKRLCLEPISGTKVEHQVEQIRLLISEVYEGVRNTKWNKSGTQQRNPPLSPSSFSPTPPISSPPIIPQENLASASTHTHEDKCPWDSAREKAYKERFIAQGCGMTASRATGRKAGEIMRMLDAFLAKCELGELGHKEFSHFNNHFLQFIRNPDNAITNGNTTAINKRGSAGVSDASDILEPF